VHPRSSEWLIIIDHPYIYNIQLYIYIYIYIYNIYNFIYIIYNCIYIYVCITRDIPNWNYVAAIAYDPRPTQAVRSENEVAQEYILILLSPFPLLNLHKPAFPVCCCFLPTERAEMGSFWKCNLVDNERPKPWLTLDNPSDIDK